MNKDITNFLHELSKTESYSLLFLSFYKNPDYFFDSKSKYSNDEYLNSEEYMTLFLNQDFIKLLKMCVLDEDFLKRIKSETCVNISHFLDYMCKLKRKYSNYIFGNKTLPVEDYFSKSPDFEKYKILLKRFSEYEIMDLDEEDLKLLKIKIYKISYDIDSKIEEYEKYKDLKKRIYNFFDRKGLNGLCVEFNKKTYLICLFDDGISAEPEFITSLLCENKFLELVEKFLDEPNNYDNGLLQKIYKIIETGIEIKSKMIDCSDFYMSYIEKHLDNDTIKSFDLTRAKKILSEITILLYKKPPLKTDFKLIRGKK